MLTKHEDIRQAARRPEIFSSSHGLHLHQLRLTPDEVEVYATLYGSGEQFAFADPPRHRELRGVATRIFAPRPLERLGEQVRRDVAELVGKIEPGRSLDFVEEVAAVLPIRVAVALIGLPSGHDADIRRWSDALESLKLIHGADNIRAAIRQFSEMDEFFRASSSSSGPIRARTSSRPCSRPSSTASPSPNPTCSPTAARSSPRAATRRARCWREWPSRWPSTRTR